MRNRKTGKAARQRAAAYAARKPYTRPTGAEFRTMLRAAHLAGEETAEAAGAELRRFALRVLAILEEDGDWNADTFDRINAAALAGKLSREDAAFFTRTAEGRGE